MYVRMHVCMYDLFVFTYVCVCVYVGVKKTHTETKEHHEDVNKM